MSAAESTDPRQATSARNVQAILDATERLLARRQAPTVSAVAKESSLSRPTVYAHFPERSQIVEALVERTVSRAMAAIAPAEPQVGPPDEALRRLLAASWEQIALHEDIAQASAAELGADAMRRAHEGARALIADLLERGRRDGTFRSDLPVGWLVTCCLALVHATAEEVRAHELSHDDAFDALLRTVDDLLAGPTR
jgi:AcrR family transcriptional regulator